MPFTALVLVTHYSQRPVNLSKLVAFVTKNYLLWFAAVVTFSFLLWPALWYVPVEVANVLYKGIFVVGVDTEHIQYYFGKVVEDPGYLFYLVVLLYRSSMYLILGATLLIVTFRKLESKEKRFISFFFLFAFFYLVELTLPSKKLDRYVLPAILALSIISAFSLRIFLEKVKVWKPLKYLFFFAPALALLIYIHPDYFTYYNPLYGGLRSGIYVIEPKWMIGAGETVNFFKTEIAKEHYEYSGTEDSFEELVNTKRTQKVLTVAFPEKYYTQIWPFFREIGGWAVIEDLSPFARETTYFVYPVWDDFSNTETRFDLEYYDAIKIRGVPIYNVYKRIAPTWMLF